MKKYIIYIINSAIPFEVDKINLNILDYGIEFNVDIENKNRKLIIPWQQVRSIEEINT